LAKIIRYIIIRVEVSVLGKSRIANHRFLFLGKFANMNTLRTQVVQSLEVIPDERLGEVLDFLRYLVQPPENHQTQQDTDWQESDLSGLESYDAYEWQEGELEEGLPIKFIAETGNIEIAI